MAYKPRFRIDVQTLTHVVTLGVPTLAMYLWLRPQRQSEEEQQKMLEEQHVVARKAAAKGNSALKTIFQQRREGGQFNEDFDEKLDGLLRKGNKRRVRVNTDNENFHVKDGMSGIQRGLQHENFGTSTDSLVALNSPQPLLGSEIIKRRRREQRRRRKAREKAARELQESGSESSKKAVNFPVAQHGALLSELAALRSQEATSADAAAGRGGVVLSSTEVEEIRKRKADIKMTMKKQGWKY